MKKYKVLGIHIGDDPHNPYVPGHAEFGTRTLPATDAKPLLDLGLLGEIDEAEGSNTASADAAAGKDASEARFLALQRTLTEREEALRAATDRVADLQSQLDASNARADQAEGDFAGLRQQHSDLQVGFDAVTADLTAAQEANAELAKQIEDAANSSGAKVPAKSSDKPAKAD